VTWALPSRRPDATELRTRQGERYNNPPPSHLRETAADERQTGG